MSKADLGNALATWEALYATLPDDYHPDAQYYFNRLIVKPSDVKKQAISDFIVTCVADGTWQYIVVLLLFRMHDSQSRRFNLKQIPGNAFDAVFVNAPTKPGITVSSSWLKGDGFSVLRTPYFCPTGLQNDHHIGMVGETAAGLDGLACGNANAGIGFKNAAGGYSERVNSDFLSAQIATGKSHVILNRKTAAGYDAFRDGVKASRVKSSLAPSQQPMTIFGNAEKASYWAGEASAWHAGTAFPTDQHATLFTSRLAALNAALAA